MNNDYPVVEGQLLSVRPDGIGKKGDAFATIDGFVIFIKRVPENKVKSVVKARVVNVKSNCGIAVYEE